MSHGLEIRVTGKVQGVWFRRSSQIKADELDLKGSVRNDPDGSVLIRVFGVKANVDLFLKWCNEGPPYSRVVAVDCVEIPYRDLTAFQILR